MTGFVDTIESCDPGQPLECAKCGKVVEINWGLMEPDHLSTWMNPEHCPHHICQYVYSGKAAKQKEESLKAAYKYCGPK